MAAALAMEWWWLPPEGYPQRYGYTGEQYQPIGSLFIQLIIGSWRWFRSWFDHDTITTLAIVATAVFTGTLWRATDRLWRISQIHARHGRKAADAATKSANMAERTLIITQRPFLHLTKFDVLAMRGPDNRVRRWRIVIEFDNYGQTPAIEVKAGGGIEIIKKGDPEEIDFSLGEHPSGGDLSLTIGPRTGGSIPPVYVTVEQAQQLANGEITIFICGIIEYRDGFEGTPMHHTGICVRLIIEFDLFAVANPFRFSSHTKYNYAD